MKRQHITDSIDEANRLLALGWLVQDTRIAVSAGGMDSRGLSDSGISYVASKLRIESRLIVLVLEDAEKCRGVQTSSFGSKFHARDCCNGTGYIQRGLNAL